VFALTPPRHDTERERAREIADATVARLRPLGLDGLILYDIDDETERNPAERPFPFMPTLDPAEYLADHLRAWPTPVIVYRAVSKYAPDELRAWLSAQDPARVMTVLVGAPSSATTGRTSLADAQALRREVNPALALGGVAIPERHSRREDEHLRLLAKQEAGCRFFVTQVVYDLNAAKNLVSDYHYECRARGVSAVPFVFVLGLRVDEDAGLPAVARRRCAALDRERPQARRRPAGGLLRAGARHGYRADGLLPDPRRPVRDQRRERVDQARRDRGLGAPREATPNANGLIPPEVITYNHMVVLLPAETETELDRLFHALADSTRRDLLRRSADGELSVSRLAEGYAMSFAAVQKHVAVLERAGLVTKARRGREQLVRTDPAAVARAREALDALEATWRGRIDRMTDLLTPPTEGQHR